MSRVKQAHFQKLLPLYQFQPAASNRFGLSNVKMKFVARRYYIRVLFISAVMTITCMPSVPLMENSNGNTHRMAALFPARWYMIIIFSFVPKINVCMSSVHELAKSCGRITLKEKF